MYCEQVQASQSLLGGGEKYDLLPPIIQAFFNNVKKLIKGATLQYET